MFFCEFCMGDGDCGHPEHSECCSCGGIGRITVEQARFAWEHDQAAWAEDEADMQRIKDEWDAFDRDPPGS